MILNIFQHRSKCDLKWYIITYFFFIKKNVHTLYKLFTTKMTLCLIAFLYYIFSSFKKSFTVKVRKLFTLFCFVKLFDTRERTLGFNLESVMLCLTLQLLPGYLDCSLKHLLPAKRGPHGKNFSISVLRSNDSETVLEC